MQYVVTISRKSLAQDDLVFFECDSAAVLQLDGVLSTDGNAASGDTSFYHGDGALPHLDWQVLNCPNCYSREYKRKKAAEVLVPDMVTIDVIDRVSTFSDGALRRLEATSRKIAKLLKVEEADLPPIQVNTGLYHASL